MADQFYCRDLRWNKPDYISGVATGDSLANLIFHLKVEEAEGDLTIGIPLTSFEPVRDQFDPVEMRELRSPAELHAERRQILDLVQGTGCDLVVKLGELELGLEAILQLREGDLIPLEQPVEGALQVEIAGKPFFKGIVFLEQRVPV